MDFAVIGGDARMGCLAGALRREGYDARRLTGEEPDFIAGVRAARRVVVNWPPKLIGSRLISPEELLGNVPGDARIYLCGPKSPDELPEGAKAVDLWKDEILLRENAYLTAEGALQSAMRAGRRSLRELRCLVIGWGRIGRALVELLVALGARVTVASRSEAGRNHAIKRGAEAVATEDIARVLPGIDLVFSTPPAMVLDAGRLAAAGPETMILDLASPPYGVDLSAAWARGLRAWREPGIPGRMYPESAGRALMRAILREEERDHA